MMRNSLLALAAGASMAFASPALADPNGSTFADYSGPDLATKIHASQDPILVAPNEGAIVYGNTSTSAGHNVAFSGFSSYNATTGTGTATDISITGGAGFAQINDLDFDNQNAATQNLYAVIFNPDPTF